MKITLLSFLLFYTFSCSFAQSSPKLITISQTDLLKPGDILFQDLDCGDLCNAIETVTKGYRGANFSHCGMIVSIKNGEVKIIEAIGEEVQVSLLPKFLSRSKDSDGNPKVMVGRPGKKARKYISSAIDVSQNYLGKPYDAVFNLKNDRYYCSELIHQCFIDAGKKIFKENPMTFKDPKTDSFFPAWVEYFESLKARIPEGKLGLNPGGMSRSKSVDVIYMFGRPSGFSN